MAKADVLFDKTEIIVQIADKMAMSMNIRAEEIISVTFRPSLEKKLFKKIPSEVILIKTKKMPGMPLAITKEAIENRKSGAWENVKTSMAKFVKDNRLTSYYETEVWEQPKMAGGPGGPPG